MNNDSNGASHEPWCATVVRDEDYHDCNCGPLTPDQAAAIKTGHGFGMMLDGIHEYWAGINCYTCGKFVGRDGYISIGHFEMSSEVAYVEGECRKCMEADRVS
ncbi:MAG: hypothetical protein JWL76_2006 [Thermoleophilia bacterium]|nr:hypothetical protein [Thermoleophilia bacterium]